MEYEQYQRPREKLRYAGTQALSVRELLQIILGSGSQRASSATIARHIEGLLTEGTMDYDTLVAIRGVGEAKACQILATCELSLRFASRG